MSIIFNDVTQSWEWDADDNKVKDLKNRTDAIKTTLDSVKTMGDSNTLHIVELRDLYYQIKIKVNVLSLSQMDIISRDEMKTLYKMLLSPDAENKIVAVECINEWMNKLEKGEI